MRLPKSVMMAAEVQVLAHNIAEAVGWKGPVHTARIDNLPEFLPSIFKPDAPITCHLAFATEFTGDKRFAVVGWPDNVDGEVRYDGALYTEEGFQVWPPNPSDCVSFGTFERMAEDHMEGLVVPFMQRLVTLPAGRFDKWIADNLKMREEGGGIDVR